LLVFVQTEAYYTSHSLSSTSTKRISIPLLEGGLLYRGAFTELNSDWVNDVLIFADNQILNSVQFKQIAPTEYQATSSAEVPSLESTLNIHTSPENSQQFFGSVTSSGGQRIKFLYKDIHEPITIGVLTIVVVGVGAALCALNDIIGRYANMECKKVKVSFGLHWKGGVSMGCDVECVDPK